MATTGNGLLVKYTDNTKKYIDLGDLTRDIDALIAKLANAQTALGGIQTGPHSAALAAAIAELEALKLKYSRVVEDVDRYTGPLPVVNKYLKYKNKYFKLRNSLTA